MARTNGRGSTSLARTRFTTARGAACRRETRLESSRREGTELTIIIVHATVVARPETLDELLEMSLEHCRRSRSEPGCLTHGVHQNPENPLELTFYEEWESRQALATHFQVPGSIDYVTRARSLAAAPPAMQTYEATRIEMVP